MSGISSERGHFEQPNGLLGVTSRTILWTFVEEFWMGFLPLFHGLNWIPALQGRLGWLVVIELHVAKQCLVHVEGAIEPVGLEHLTDPAIEALDHLVGLRRARLGQSVLNSQILAQHIRAPRKTPDHVRFW